MNAFNLNDQVSFLYCSCWIPISLVFDHQSKFKQYSTPPNDFVLFFQRHRCVLPNALPLRLLPPVGNVFHLMLLSIHTTTTDTYRSCDMSHCRLINIASVISLLRPSVLMWPYRCAIYYVITQSVCSLQLYDFGCSRDSTSVSSFYLLLQYLLYHL